jgi:hypothetical protein
VVASATNPSHVLASASPERGSALLWAVGLMSATVALVFSDIDLMRAGTQEQTVAFAENGQAAGVAHAGLSDAYAWLRRQTVQPVAVFAPRRDLEADPPINETDDASVGLVREYELSPGIWGRYEVRAGRPMDPFVDANANGSYDAGETFTDLTRVGGVTPSPGEFVAGRVSDGYGDGKWTPSRWSRDVSSERGWSARGTVWRLESRGMIYRREREDYPLGRDPNVLLATVTSASEVSRMVLTPPAAAAICATKLSEVTLGDRVRLRATGGLAVGVETANGSFNQAAGAEVYASTRYAAVPGYDSSIKRVFGVEWAELKSLADISSKGLSGMPDDMQEGSLVVLERDVTYDAELPLLGSGVLVIKGDLTIAADSKSYFTGVLYVDGDVTIYGPALIRGTIIATGGVHLEGSSGDYVELENDPLTVNRVLGAMSQYRFSRAVYTPDRRLLDSAVTFADPWTPTPDPVGGPGPGGGGPYVPPPAYGNSDEDNERAPVRRGRR